MSRVTPLLLALVFLALLVGCGPAKSPAYCNENPNDPDCFPDAEAVGGLSYRSLVEDGDAGVRTTGECGAYQRTINWLMPEGAPTDGYIVQHIEVAITPECSTTDPADLQSCPAVVPRACTDDMGQAEYLPLYWTYWEAWQVNAGAVAGASDAWRLNSQAVPQGNASIHGHARFYADEMMGDEHPERPGSPFTVGDAMINHAGPVTWRAPLFWQADERPALSREVRVTWTCCPPGETRIEEDTHDR